VARIEGDRAPVRFNGTVQAAVRLEDDAEIAVSVGLIGRECKTPLCEREGLAILPSLMCEHTGVMQCTGVIGCSLEHPPVHLPRFCELLVLLQKNRERDGFFERQLALR
jgi:hypothetical protein